MWVIQIVIFLAVFSKFYRDSFFSLFLKYEEYGYSYFNKFYTKRFAYSMESMFITIIKRKACCYEKCFISGNKVFKPFKTECFIRRNKVFRTYETLCFIL